MGGGGLEGVWGEVCGVCGGGGGGLGGILGVSQMQLKTLQWTCSTQNLIVGTERLLFRVRSHLAKRMGL